MNDELGDPPLFAWAPYATQVGLRQFRAVVERPVGDPDRMVCEHRHQHHDTAMMCARKWAQVLNHPPSEEES